MCTSIRVHARGEAFKIILRSHHRVMRSTKGKVKEKWRRRALVSDKLERFPFEHRGLILGFHRYLLVAFPEIMEDLLLAGAHSVVAVRIIVRPPGIKPEELIESLSVRAALGRS